MKEYSYCPICGSLLTEKFMEGIQRKCCPRCAFVHYENPLPVALAVPVRNKKLLMIKRGIKPQKGSWAFPAGFIECGETSEEACLRELMEETGLSGKIQNLIGVERIEDKEVYGDLLVIAYSVELEKGNPVAGDEVDQVQFFESEEWPNYRFKGFETIINNFKK